MKTNHLLSAALVATLAVGVAGCSNELTDEQAPQSGKSTSIIASVPTSADTRLNYDESNASKLALTWKTNDALSVYKTDFTTAATTYTLEASAAGTKNANFSTSEASSYTDDDDLIAIYPQGTYTGDAAGLTLSVAGQSGVLADSPHHYMFATTKYKSDETPTFAFSHLMAAVKLELEFSDLNAGDKVKNVSLSGFGLFDKAVIAKDGTLTSASDANARVSTTSGTEFTLNTGKKAVVYLFVFPTSVSGAKVTATAGTKNYEFKLTDAALANGNVYKVAAAMTEATATTWFGDGSATNYYVGTEQDLQAFAATVNGGQSMKGKTVHLLADIDLENKEHTPIGKSSSSFMGVFEGHGKTVSNIKIDKADTDDQAFFGDIDEAVIKDLTVTGNITGKSDIAGIAVGGAGIIMNCVNRVNVTGKEGYVAGIVALGNGVNAIACENYGTVIGASSRCGGISAVSYDANLIACINHAAVNVANQSLVGGISGELNNQNAKMYACINEGVVTAKNASGGVIGNAANYSEIKASYFTNGGNFKFAGIDGKGDGWNSVTSNTYAEINSKVSDMNAAITEWNAAHTSDGLACPYIYQASSTPSSALPTLVPAP